MSDHDKAAFMTKAYDYFSKSDYEGLSSCLADDIELTSYSFGLTFNGHDAALNFLKGWKTAFPDMTITLDNQLVCGDYVVSEFTASGTHTGTLYTPDGNGIPATGKSVSLNVCEVNKVTDGKITILHNYLDSASLLMQIGAIK